jgi:hypothetical protein
VVPASGLSVALMMIVPDVIWTTADLPPPPPGFDVDLVDLFGFTITTLPALPEAEYAAAAVAEVDRSPATAAKEAWN